MKLIVLQNQEQFGPFDLNQIQCLVNEGYFQLTDYCWEEGWSDWRLLSSIVNRIPAGLQSAISTPPKNIPEIPPEEFPAKTDFDDLGFMPLVATSIIPHSINELEINTLRPGMIVKNDSQSVSCDFITSLAVRGVYVKPGPKSETSLHIARGTENIGCFTLTDISTHLESGDLLPTDLFWKESTGEWIDLAQIT